MKNQGCSQSAENFGEGAVFSNHHFIITLTIAWRGEVFDSKGIPTREL